MKHIVKIVRVS